MHIERVELRPGSLAGTIPSHDFAATHIGLPFCAIGGQF